MIRLVKFRIFSICWALCLVPSPFALHAQVIVDSQAKASVCKFAEEFYAWYVPIARADNPDPAWELALKSKKDVFDRPLAQAIKEDLDAQAKFPGEIVGIDFDPFLYTQDPAKRYTIGKVSQKGERYLVEIHGNRNGKKIDGNALTAEIAKKGGRWVFTNFYYSKGKDLLSILRSLKVDRQKLGSSLNGVVRRSGPPPISTP